MKDVFTEVKKTKWFKKWDKIIDRVVGFLQNPKITPEARIRCSVMLTSIMISLCVNPEKIDKFLDEVHSEFLAVRRIIKKQQGESDER